MSCAGRGVCDCGRPSCDEASWWFRFQHVWRVVSWNTRQRLLDAQTDDDIDFEREQQAT